MRPFIFTKIANLAIFAKLIEANLRVYIYIWKCILFVDFRLCYIANHEKQLSWNVHLGDFAKINGRENSRDYNHFINFLTLDTYIALTEWFGFILFKTYLLHINTKGWKCSIKNHRKLNFTKASFSMSNSVSELRHGLFRNCDMVCFGLRRS